MGAAGFIFDKRKVSIIMTALEELETDIERTMCSTAVISSSDQDRELFLGQVLLLEDLKELYNEMFETFIDI